MLLLAILNSTLMDGKDAKLSTTNSKMVMNSQLSIQVALVIDGSYSIMKIAQ